MAGLKFFRGSNWLNYIKSFVCPENVSNITIEDLPEEPSKFIKPGTLKDMNREKVENELKFNHYISDSYMSQFTAKKLKKLLTYCRKNNISGDESLLNYVGSERHEKK